MTTPVRVIVLSPTGATVQNRIGDHDNDEFRKWMGRTAFWAFRNSHVMVSIPVGGSITEEDVTGVWRAPVKPAPGVDDTALAS